MDETGRHIDVIEDFVYNSVNRQYNTDFLRWRRHTKAPFIYRYTNNTKENVYSTGSSARQSAESAEKKALLKCSELIGAALLIFLLIEVGGGSLLTAILHLFKIDIRMDFLTLSMNGSQWAVAGVRALIAVLKYAVPGALLIRFCKIPQGVFAPASPGAMPEMIAASAAGMLIAGIYSLTAQSEGLNMAQRLYTYKDMSAVIAYGFFDALIASILAEVLLRGCILTLLRQFGDPFAIGITALIAFLFPNQLSARISELMIGLTAGYLMIRAGSIAKCVVLRITYTGLTYARLIVVYSDHELRLWEYALLLISIGTLAMMFYVSIRREMLKLHNRKSALSDSRKTSAMMQSMTMLSWTAVALLLTLLQLFY